MADPNKYPERFRYEITQDRKRWNVVQFYTIDGEEHVRDVGGFPSEEKAKAAVSGYERADAKYRLNLELQAELHAPLTAGA